MDVEQDTDSKKSNGNQINGPNSENRSELYKNT